LRIDGDEKELKFSPRCHRQLSGKIIHI